MCWTMHGRYVGADPCSDLTRYSQRCKWTLAHTAVGSPDGVGVVREHGRSHGKFVVDDTDVGEEIAVLEKMLEFCTRYGR